MPKETKAAKKIRGLMNRGQARQLKQLGIDPGPSPSQSVRAKRGRPPKKHPGKPSTGSR